ncbi:MAG: methyltransferase [Phycisphaerae bacterium]
MTSRQRVIAALNHEEPDRVPIDFGGHASSSIAILAYMKLKSALGITEGLPRIYHVWGQIPDIAPAVLARLHSDTVQLHRLRASLGIRNLAWKEWEVLPGKKVLVSEEFNPVTDAGGDTCWYEGDTLVARLPASRLHGFTLMHCPLANSQTKADIDRFFDTPGEGNHVSRVRVSDEEVAYLRSESARLRASTDRAIVGMYGTVIENAQGILGWDELFVRLIEDWDLARHFLERLTDSLYEGLKRYLAAVGDNVDVIVIGDDLGSQKAPLLSAEMYRETLLPYHRRLIDYIRRHSKAYVLFHSDGSMMPFFRDLIDAGVHAFNPVQTDAAGMDPAVIKREFGREMTIWGAGCDTHSVLYKGNEAQVIEDVRRRLQILAPGGGFVFNQIHNVLPETKARNVIAMYDYVYAHGRYPIETGGMSLDDLQRKYADYWENALEKLRAGGV